MYLFFLVTASQTRRPRQCSRHVVPIFNGYGERRQAARSRPVRLGGPRYLSSRA